MVSNMLEQIWGFSVWVWSIILVFRKLERSVLAMDDYLKLNDCFYWKYVQILSAHKTHGEWLWKNAF